MACKLISEAKAGALTAESLSSRTESIESIFSSDPFEVSVIKCAECGEIFIHCFKQYTSPNWDDDYWTFWIPVDQTEIDRVKGAPILLKHMGELADRAPLICWHPDGQIFWVEDGFPLALVVFMP